VLFENQYNARLMVATIIYAVILALFLFVCTERIRHNDGSFGLKSAAALTAIPFGFADVWRTECDGACG
jgi:hypothetical protein